MKKILLLLTFLITTQASYAWFEQPYIPRQYDATANTSSAETAVLISAPSNSTDHIYVSSLLVSAGGAQTIKLVENTSSAVDVIEVIYLPANGTATITFEPAVQLSAGVNLGYTTSAAAATSVTVTGWIGR